MRVTDLKFREKAALCTPMLALLVPACMWQSPGLVFPSGLNLSLNWEQGGQSGFTKTQGHYKF